MLPREALARALRLNRHGDVRPVWALAPETTQQPYLAQADFILRELKEQRYLLLRPEEWAALPAPPLPDNDLKSPGDA